MVRLSAALLVECPQVTTPLGERALLVRGKNLQQLEAFAASTGVTKADDADEQDAGVLAAVGAGGKMRDLLFEVACNFDVLDLSFNALPRLDGFNFPVQPVGASAPSEWSVVSRLSTLILHNNQVSRISDSTIRSLAPTLHTFVAHNNCFAHLHQLDVFAQLPNLERLGLIGNPVTFVAQYRLYVIGRCGKTTKLKLLDYNRVLDSERKEAEQLGFAREVTKAAKVGGRRRGAMDFGNSSAMDTVNALSTSNDGAAQASIMESAKRLRTEAAPAAVATPKLSPAEVQAKIQAIEAKIDAATSNEEIALLEEEYNALLALAA